jgi:hypothetical protein
MQVYDRHKHFRDDWESVNDNPCCGFFEAQDLIHYEFILEGHTANKEMYMEILSPQGCSEKETSRKMGMKQLAFSA